MIEVAEGDCYIVDLFNSEGSQDIFQDANKWRRFLIDTGTKDKNRLGVITGALTEYNKLDPWPDIKKVDPSTIDSNQPKIGTPKTLPKLKLPPLSGVIITHSDRDHSGNAHLLLKDLGNGELGKIIPFDKAHKFTRVPIYMTPMVEWTRNGGPNDPTRFIKLVKKRTEVKVQNVVRPATAERSFKELYDLCEAGDYVAKFRFNVLKPGCINAIKSQTQNAELRDMKKYYYEFRDKWNESRTFNVASYLSNLRKAHRDDSFLQNTTAYEVLVEVGIEPVSVSRTYEGGAFDTITGPWLRLTTTFPGPGMKVETGSPLPDNADKITVSSWDLNSVNPPPYGMDFVAEPVNLADRYGKIFAAGPWSNSMMGCADKQYTRDFQHFILQSMVDPTNQDLLPDRKQNLWSEYANRASILNFFTYHSNGNPQDHNKESAPYTDTGNFKMLFTGDAFELSQGLKKMQKLRNAVDSIALERVGTLDYYDFTVPPQAKSSKGNLLEWLSGTKEMNQKVNVNVLKVPHHGSRMTTDPSLFYYVTANVYLISGSLQVHAHPAFSTLRAMVRYAWAKDGSTPAKAPSKYRSQATSLVAELTESIEKRSRPRLVFLSFATREATWKEGHVSLEDKLALICGHKEGWTNMKFLAQRKKNSSGRIKIGRDKNRPDDLRVEWDPEAWTELRPDGLSENLWNTLEDPLAYPSPGDDPKWEISVP